MRCAIGGCGGTPSAVASDAGTLDRIATDGLQVFFTDSTWLDGRLLACPVGGCIGAPTVLLSGLTYPSGIALDKATVYLSESPGWLLAVDK